MSSMLLVTPNFFMSYLSCTIGQLQFNLFISLTNHAAYTNSLYLVQISKIEFFLYNCYWRKRNFTRNSLLVQTLLPNIKLSADFEQISRFVQTPLRRFQVFAVLLIREVGNFYDLQNFDKFSK